MAWLTPSAGILPAQVQMHYAGGSPHVQRQKTWDEVLSEAAKVIAPAVKSYVEQKRTDRIAETLRAMKEAEQAGQDPVNDLEGRDWLQAQSMWEQYQNDQLKRVKLERQAYPEDYPKDRTSERGGVERYPVTLPNGEIVYVTGNEALHYSQRTTKPEKPDTWESYVEIARGRKNEKGEFDNQYSDARSGDMVQLRTPEGKIITAPYEYYQRRVQRNPALPQRPYVADPGSETVIPKTDYTTGTDMPQKPVKKLDPETAKAILSEAGGDKEKARQIARSRGYFF